MARRLFVERGYDNTTVRRIGRDANVGLGTVFAEVADKRALLFLCFNAELQTVLDGALKKSSAT
ncbi:helix-turn-helix domain-containing protein [Croceicoccus naphthovorans]|uniref:Uncharacterized protein n=1 Tax=Croceicoccus naphthovorans TaxID=1348774 RepID=A0A0G3XJ56_9SPHN|nr:helix-turn-helix domain-containing protein [Croceicoccus naphthovorans]AKM10418.1 hypothetical protein AB433_11310 [Croceicoccus naphthovorans]MBB3990119.1 AcrR family transcriptional regulator [Croceicoccus naphthovorans]